MLLGPMLGDYDEMEKTPHPAEHIGMQEGYHIHTYHLEHQVLPPPIRRGTTMTMQGSDKPKQQS